MKYIISSNYKVDNSEEAKLIKTATEKDLLDWIKDKDIIEIDTETIKNSNDSNGYVFTFQVGDNDNQYVLDCTESNNIELVKSILKTDKIKVLQNAKYDIKWFLNWGINPTNIYDTMLAEMCINLGYKAVGLSLDKISYRYLNVEVSKEIRGQINYLGLTPAVVNYAATDVEYLSKIREAQLKVIKEKGLEKVVELENKVVRVFAEMESTGIYLNEKKWLEVEKYHKDLVKTKEKELTEYLLNHKIKKYLYVVLDMFEGEKLQKFNFNSSQQIVNVLNLIGKESKKKQLINLTNANEAELQKIAYLEPFINIYLDYKEQITNVAKYGSNFLLTKKKFKTKEGNESTFSYPTINPNTGRVHYDYWQMVETGRVSCNSPNMQQIPAHTKHRSCFEPREGYSFVSCDFSSQELVLIAEDSQEPVWIEAVQKGWDLHSSVAEMVFKKIWKNAAISDCLYYKTKQKCNCPEHKKLRDKIKTINYALSYGAGYNKIAANLRISPDEAKNIINEYFSTMTQLKKIFNTLGKFGKDNFYIRTFSPFRRIRHFVPTTDDSELDSIRRQSMNTRYQGTGADMMKLALVNLYDHHKTKYGNDVYFILQIHDQVVLEVKDELAEQVLKETITIMRDVSKIMLKTLTVDVDGEISKYWKH
jgi:DNA polymerase I-like protein with 3'-5' exonuclease and polymerase domains